MIMGIIIIHNIYHNISGQIVHHYKQTQQTWRFFIIIV